MMQSETSPLPPGPAYNIRTKRLVVRCWEPTDLFPLHGAIEASIEHLRPWLGWVAQEPITLQQRLEYLRQCRGQFDLGQEMVYGIFDATGSTVIGASGLHKRRSASGTREVGYWIHPAFLGRGFASEAAAALTRVSFDIEGAHRVDIICAVQNDRSAAIARKLGFVHEATLRGRATWAGAVADAMIWTLQADEFRASPCAAVDLTACDGAGRKIC